MQTSLPYIAQNPQRQTPQIHHNLQLTCPTLTMTTCFSLHDPQPLHLILLTPRVNTWKNPSPPKIKNIFPPRVPSLIVGDQRVKCYRTTIVSPFPMYHHPPLTLSHRTSLHQAIPLLHLRLATPATSIADNLSIPTSLSFHLLNSYLFHHQDPVADSEQIQSTPIHRDSSETQSSKRTHRP